MDYTPTKKLEEEEGVGWRIKRGRAVLVYTPTEATEMFHILKNAENPSSEAYARGRRDYSREHSTGILSFAA